MKESSGFTVLKFISGVFIIAVAVCVIVNFAVSGRISWASYTSLSIAYAWLLIAPLFLVKKNRPPVMLLTLSVITLPYLALLDILLPARNWFFPLGAPSAVVSIAALWVIYLIFRFLNINNWHKGAVIVFVFGVIVSGAVRFFTSMYIGEGLQFLWSPDNVINIAAALCVTVLLIVKGAGSPRAEVVETEANGLDFAKRGN